MEKYNRTVEELQEKISKIEKNNVLNKEKVMIKRIKDISADSILASLGDTKVEESVAAAISDLVRSTWNQESAEWEKQLKAEKEKQEEIEANRQKAQDELEAAKEKLNTIQAELNELKEKEQTRAFEEQFQSRMDYFDSEYEVSDKHRAILAKRLKEVDSDEKFEELKAELEVFLPKKEEAPSDSQETKASTDENSVDESVSTATETTTQIPNTKATTPSLQDRMANAFQIGNGVDLV